jgi:hypothetical protein
MKEYVDEKFWKMFSGFVTLIAISLAILIVIKVYKSKEASAVNTQASVIMSER